MRTLKDLLNGAQWPGWLKLILITATVASVWAGQQAAVGELQRGQKETTEAVKELRQEMRTQYVTQVQLQGVLTLVELNRERIAELEKELREDVRR